MTAGNWHRRWRATGSVRPGKQGQPGGSRLDTYEKPILAMVEAERDIALHEIAGRLLNEHGIRVVPSTVWLFFKKRGITFKTRRHTHRSNTARTSLPDVSPGSTARPISTWKTTTFTAGLRLTGMVAPMVLDGAIALFPGLQSNRNGIFQTQSTAPKKRSLYNQRSMGEYRPHDPCLLKKRVPQLLRSTRL